MALKDDMKTAFKTILTSTIGALLLQTGCVHPKPVAGTPAAGVTPPPAAAAPRPALTNLQDKLGYALGVNIGSSLKQADFQINTNELINGLVDALAGRERMTQPEARGVVRDFQRQRVQEQAEKRMKDGDAFLAQNRTKEGVQTRTVTLPDGKTAEFQYKIITEGAGPIPGTNDVVTVSYRGTYIDGREFDSSARRGHRPSKFRMDSLPTRGWAEALNGMKVGSKWEVYLPPSLAYGNEGRPNIEPGATLIFEIELVDTEAPQPPKPVTSDIIRVPSAEEMKAGAQIEVIKTEDLEKHAADGQTNQVKIAN